MGNLAQYQQTRREETYVEDQVQAKEGIDAVQAYIAQRRRELRQEDERLAALLAHSKALRHCAARLAGSSYIAGSAA